jgi:hypothetical protein
MRERYELHRSVVVVKPLDLVVCRSQKKRVGDSRSLKQRVFNNCPAQPLVFVFDCGDIVDAIVGDIEARKKSNLLVNWS